MIPLDSLELDLEKAGCPFHFISETTPDISFTYNSNGVKRIEVTTSCLNVMLKDSLQGEPQERIEVDDKDLFYVTKGEKTFQCYVKNFFIGACFHEGFYWQEL